MIPIVAHLLLLTALIIRSLRWLSIAQAKEYKWQRLLLFMRSSGGRAEIMRLIPQRSDFTLTGLKRPKITARLLITFGVAVLLVLGVVEVGSALSGLSMVRFLSGWAFLVLWVVVYVTLPIWVMLATLPSSLVKEAIVYYALSKAKAKLEARQPLIIGITGSYGKTSIKLLLSHVLSSKYSVFTTPRSFNTRYSVARSIVRGYENQEVVVLEYSAYRFGEIKRLASWFPPEIGVITGLTKQHLGLFGSLENIVEAKAELVRSLPSGASIFFNGERSGAGKVVTEGKSGKELNLVDYDQDVVEGKLDNLGRLTIKFGQQEVKTKLVGLYHLETVRGVVAVAQHLGLSSGEIQKGLESFIPSSNFTSSYRLSTGLLVIDDGGTSNPAGFQAALQLIKALKIKNKILVFGGIIDVGDESDGLHLELARSAKKVVDQVLYTGDVGQASFKKIFGERLISKQGDIIKNLENLSEESVLLIEGRMPGWLREWVANLAKEK